MSNEPITEAELVEWKAACEVIPNEEWVIATDSRGYLSIDPIDVYIDHGSAAITDVDRAVAALICHARTAMPRLIERVEELEAELRAVISARDGHRGYAETVAKLNTENERLREALAPFAKAAQYMKARDPEESGVWTYSRDRCRVTVADFQKAAAALKPAGDELITCPGCGLIDDLDGFDSGGSESGVICCRCGCEPPPAEGGGS